MLKNIRKKGELVQCGWYLSLQTESEHILIAYALSYFGVVHFRHTYFVVRYGTNGTSLNLKCYCLSKVCMAELYSVTILFVHSKHISYIAIVSDNA